MNTGHEISDEVGNVDDELEEFWRRAVFRAKLNGIPTYFGPTPLESLRPPAWSFGITAEDADTFLRQLIDGATTGIAGAVRDYDTEGERIPEPGEMSIVMDGAGRPRALIVASEVLTVPFAELDPATTEIEGGGFVSDTAMVLHRLQVLYSS